MKIYYDEDAKLEIIQNKKVAIIGYGSQGHAHALNLHESGGNVAIGLRLGSQSAQKASEKGLKVKSIEEAAAWGDVIMMLIPDQFQKKVFDNHVKQHVTPGKALGFGHGFNIHYQQILPPEEVDVFMVAPKSPGHLVRRVYVEGAGVPTLVAIHQDATGNALELALSYAKGIGGTKAGVIETNFKDETETDLFGEQAVLCGGSEALIKAGFETLVEGGYPPELAYFECLHELKLIVDLYYEGGLEYMNYSVSDTAEYGGYKSGTRVITDAVKGEMKKILDDVQSGAFAKTFLDDCENNSTELTQLRKEINQHPIEQIGKKLRAMMPWLKNKKKADTVGSPVA